MMDIFMLLFPPLIIKSAHFRKLKDNLYFGNFFLYYKEFQMLAVSKLPL